MRTRSGSHTPCLWSNQASKHCQEGCTFLSVSPSVYTTSLRWVLCSITAVYLSTCWHTHLSFDCSSTCCSLGVRVLLQPTSTDQTNKRTNMLRVILTDLLLATAFKTTNQCKIKSVWGKLIYIYSGVVFISHYICVMISTESNMNMNVGKTGQ